MATLKEAIEQLGAVTTDNPDLVHKSRALPGVTVVWRNGEINCRNLPEQLEHLGLPFVDRIRNTRFRMGSCGLEYYRRYRGKDWMQRTRGWQVCENGDHQVYFDLVKTMQQPSTPQVEAMSLPNE